MTSTLEHTIMKARSHSFADLLRRTALRTPEKTAIINGPVRWTYAEFDEAVNRTANALAARGLVKGDRLAILSHNGWEFVTVLFATARLGVVLVPINFMLNADEVAYILKHAQPKGMVAEDLLLDVATRAAQTAGIEFAVRGWIGPDTSAVPAGWETVESWSRHDDSTEPDVLIADDDPLRIMYTSGTESRPKGALLSSRSLIAEYVSCIVDGSMSADDVDLHAMPMYHCAQLDCFFGPDIYLGATNVIVYRPDPAALLKTIEQERVTKFFAPPTVWIGLLRNPEFDSTDLSSLRKGYYGASPMPVEVLREMQERLPDVDLWNFYGQTEMAPVATILRPSEQLDRAGSAGRPCINVETILVDDDGNEVPRGSVGEIVHRSPHATLGYYNDAEKTAEAFRDGWFHSGDLGVMSDDGYLTVIDRKKDMIKTGGENVASREVEEVLYEIDGVAEAAVFAIPDPKWVEAVTATVVTKAGYELETDSIIAHCRTRLAGYKVPKHVVVVESLPKNPSGKIIKRELRIQFAELGVASPVGGAST